MATRIYIVQHTANGDVRRVRAATPAQATHHVVKGRFAARVANQDDMLKHADVVVEDVGADLVAAEAGEGGAA